MTEHLDSVHPTIPFFSDSLVRLLDHFTVQSVRPES
jgi:hypothetical protein